MMAAGDDMRRSVDPLIEEEAAEAVPGGFVRVADVSRSCRHAIRACGPIAGITEIPEPIEPESSSADAPFTVTAGELIVIAAGHEYVPFRAALVGRTVKCLKIRFGYRGGSGDPDERVTQHVHGCRHAHLFEPGNDELSEFRTAPTEHPVFHRAFRPEYGREDRRVPP